MPFSCFKKSESFSDFSDSFFVITTIFNPAGFNSRYELYHQFVKHIRECGLQLITAECIFPSLNQTEFQVTNPNNPNHIQVSSNSVYWVKENLINLAVNRLPAHAKWVCWVDADITFPDPNWAHQTIKELKKNVVVQLFEKADFVGPDGKEVLRTDHSFGYSVVHKKIIDQNRYDKWYPHSGYGWAMSVDDFKKMGGLPHYDILGSGDLHFAFSLLNRVSNAVEDNLNSNFKQKILKQANQTYDTLSNIAHKDKKSLVGYVPITIRHNWHGSRKDRQYVNRWKILIMHQFDISVDMVLSHNGLLEFVSGKEQLQADIIEHFKLRKEDATEVTLEDLKIKDKGKKNKVRIKKAYPPNFDYDESSSSSDSERSRRHLDDLTFIGIVSHHHLHHPDPDDGCDDNENDNCQDPCDQPGYSDNCCDKTEDCHTYPCPPNEPLPVPESYTSYLHHIGYEAIAVSTQY